MASQVELAAMARALDLAATPGVPPGPNPRVGCVLLAPDGTMLAEGWHRGAGTAHAEVDALRSAGSAARGATAVVTLEPCHHTGRTGPCSEALLAAGVARVVFGQPDTSPVAQGGAERLRAAGVDVEGGVLAAQCRALNPVWSAAQELGRPFVTWKVAASLDGRVAAADGSSRWITGPEARTEVHRLRAEVDAVVVGTGTALADDPQLTVRDASGEAVGRQPLRVVVGRRELPAAARLLDGSAPLLQLRTHDPAEVVAELAARDVQHALLEGGPTLAGAFVDAGLVDRLMLYTAPLLLGPGPSLVDLRSVRTLAEAVRLRVDDVAQVGPDVRTTVSVVRGEES